jgi:hypothetical protein
MLIWCKVKEAVERQYGIDRVRSIKCAALSVPEQIRLFSSASVVIGAEVRGTIYEAKCTFIVLP